MAHLAVSPERIEAVRGFNRSYTRRIGVLREGLLDTRFSLTESRILWELAHRPGITATDLSRALDLDAGYLSRLLQKLKEQRLVAALRSKEDARQRRLELSAAGRRAFRPLDERSQAEAAALLGALPDADQHRLVESMRTIGTLLATDARSAEPWLLRPHRPGDLGWIVARHGAVYAAEYGWDMRFEALVARICADFVDRFEPSREACWIAERDGTNVGSVVLVQARDKASGEALKGTAQLRLLLVEPTARGSGIGARLVAECERFAREKRYRRIVLWTNSVLVAARAIYEKSGYRLVKTEAHTSFGRRLVGETWEKEIE